MSSDIINVEIVIVMPIPRASIIDGYDESNLVEAIVNDFREITDELKQGGLPVEITGRIV